MHGGNGGEDSLFNTSMRRTSDDVGFQRGRPFVKGESVSGKSMPVFERAKLTRRNVTRQSLDSATQWRGSMSYRLNIGDFGMTVRDRC